MEALILAVSLLRPGAIPGAMTFDERAAAAEARLSDPDRDDRRRGGIRMAATDLEMEGWKLSEEQAARLEDRLKRRPDDVATRVLLLGFYDNDPFEDGGRVRRKPHTLWLIQTMPGSPLTGVPIAWPDSLWQKEARRAWQPVVSAPAATAEELGNAADSLWAYDDEALGWLARAAKLQPRRALWRDMAAQIHQGKALRENDEAEAERSLEEFDAAAELGPAGGGDRRLDTLGLALRLGRLARARGEALSLLDELEALPGWQRTNALYFSEQVLAGLSLHDGDLQAARKHLLASCGGDPATAVPALSPDRFIAGELEKRGVKGAEAEYAKACARFHSPPGK